MGATNASIQGVEAISAATAGAGVTITLSGQSEGFTLTGSGFADTITGGDAADTIAAGAGNDTINLASGDFAAGESIDGGANSDTIVLTNGTTVDFSVGTVTNVEALTGSTGSDTVTLSALQLAGFGTVNLVSGTTDTLNVVANGNISQLALATLSNIDSGNLIGTAGTDSITLTGAQLNAILIGSGTINLGSGAGDTINLTSTSSDLNTLGATNTAIQGVEAISAATAGAGVTITLSAQTEGFSITGSGFADTITGGDGCRHDRGGGRQRHDQPGQRRLRLGRVDRWRRQQRHHRPDQCHDGGLHRWHGDERRDLDGQHRQRHRHAVGIAAGQPRDRQPCQRHGHAERRGQREHLAACACRD